jgi:hypothetical protein
MAITLSWCVLHITYGALSGRLAGVGSFLGLQPNKR